MRVFLGITGASGAPYAARLLEVLAAADCEVGVCASTAGVEVLATELYGQARLSRDETLARLTERCGDAVTIHDPNVDTVRFLQPSLSVRENPYAVAPLTVVLGSAAAVARTPRPSPVPTSIATRWWRATTSAI